MERVKILPKSKNYCIYFETNLFVCFFTCRHCECPPPKFPDICQGHTDGLDTIFYFKSIWGRPHGAQGCRKTGFILKLL